MIMRPDGKLHVQSGVGNLGTHSVIDLARVAADVLAMPWERVEVVWGDTARTCRGSCMSVGSQTTHAMTRANLAGADGPEAQAAGDRGEGPGRRAGRLHAGRRTRAPRDNPSRGLTLRPGGGAGHRARRLVRRPRAARRTFTPSPRRAAAKLAGLGLMGVAKDNYPRDGDTYSFVAGFAEVEVDVETGA